MSDTHSVFKSNACSDPGRRALWRIINHLECQGNIVLLLINFYVIFYTYALLTTVMHSRPSLYDWALEHFAIIIIITSNYMKLVHWPLMGGL